MSSDFSHSPRTKSGRRTCRMWSLTDTHTLRLRTLIRHTAALQQVPRSRPAIAALAHDKTSIHRPTIWPRNVLSTKAGTTRQLSVRPTSGLVDEDLDIRVSGLGSGQVVKLRARTWSECGRYGFQSSAIYRADSRGNISGMFLYNTINDWGIYETVVECV